MGLARDALMAGASKQPDDEPLKRLGGGRWRSRDERFTIEPQSGTWVVVDAEQVDDLGLPLVRGPFGSLRAAKDAMASARETGALASPLAERTRDTTEAATDRAGSTDARPKAERPAPTTKRRAPATKAASPARSVPSTEAEPRWLTELTPRDRRQARRLIDDLRTAGASDPEGIVRRDVVGDVPSTATFAIRRRLDGLGPAASIDEILDLLVDGRDKELDVRWRLVDGHGRPIGDLSG
jgi:hypothetical protein